MSFYCFLICNSFAMVNLINLNVEMDASFTRAIPILKEKVPAEYLSSSRSVLGEAAFIFVIGALTSFLSLRYLWLLISRLRSRLAVSRIFCVCYFDH